MPTKLLLLVQPWASRALGHGPQLVSLLLAALIVVDCARLAAPFVHARATTTRELQDTPQVNRPAAVDAQLIVQRHLFGVADEPTDDSATPAPVAANLALLGTIATDNPKRGFAIVGINGPGKVFTVGEDLVGASLQAVYLDHIVLRRGSRQESLYLPRLTLSLGKMPARRVAPAGVGTPEKFGDIFALDPSVNFESGDLLGFRLRRSGPRGTLMPTGLETGDILTAIDGESLTGADQDQGEKIVNNLLASTHAVVSVLRNGASVDVTVDVGQ